MMPPAQFLSATPSLLESNCPLQISTMYWPVLPRSATLEAVKETVLPYEGGETLTKFSAPWT